MSPTTRPAVPGPSGRHLAHAAAVCLVIAALGGVTEPALDAQGALFNVYDSRPLARAVEKFIDRCRCVITYEDPRWTAADVEDRTEQISRVNPPPRRLFVPRERSLTFEDDQLPPHPAQAPLRAQVQKAVAEYNRSGAGEAFRVDQGDGALHVRPAKRSVLDARISLPGTTGTTSQVLAMFIGEMQKHGVPMFGGLGPTNFLQQSTITVRADNEPAQRVLTRILAETGRTIAWQLNYDYTLNVYALNLQLTDPAVCREDVAGQPCVLDLGDTLNGHKNNAPQPQDKPQQ